MSDQESIRDKKDVQIFDLGLIMRLISLGFTMGFSVGKKLSFESRIIESIAASTSSYALQMTMPRAGNVVVDTSESGDITKGDEVFEDEKLAFYKLKPVLLQDKKYYGKYVAVVGGQLVDFDDDKTALIKRIYSSKGYVVMYVGRIIEEELVLELPSPELV